MPTPSNAAAAHPRLTRLRLALPAAFMLLALLACGQVGPTPTVPPPPDTPTASPSPGPQSPTPRPEALTQPALTPDALPTEATSETPTAVSTLTDSPSPPVAGGEFFVPVADIGGSVPGTVLALRFTPEGTLWLLTDQAVARLVGDAWEIYLPEYEGELVGLDDLHRVWVADPGGESIQAWDGEEWQAYDEADGWVPASPGPAGSAVQPGLTADQAGRVWLVTSDDVRAFDGESWQAYDRAALGLAEAGDSEAATQFHVTVAPRDGAVWVSACDLNPPGSANSGGVRWLDGSDWQGEGSPVEAGCGGAVAASTQGTVWVGLDDALLAYEPETDEWATYAAPEAPAVDRFGYVADIALDSAEQPWPLLMLCGGEGCSVGQARYRLDADGEWVQVGAVTEAPQTLLFDSLGGGWLLSEAGTQLAAGDEVYAAGDMRILASARDSVGQIYVAGEQGGAPALYLIRPPGE